MLPDGLEHAKGHAPVIAEKVCKRERFEANSTVFSKVVARGP
jgi:hypothetical protein